jgi:hypothetical protein
MPDEPDDLDELMQRAYDEGVMLGAATGDELRTPVLVAVDGLGRPSLVVINPPPSAHPADVARIMLWSLRAERAAVCFEGWGVDVRATTEELATGAPPSRPLDPRPSEHPDRYETLSVVGQVRGRPIRMRQYRVVREPGRPRRFEPRSLDGGVLMPSRFNPLFVPDDKIAALLRHNADLARIRRDMKGRRS